MKTKIFLGTMAYPFLDKFVIKVDRGVINSQPHRIESRFYKFDYMSNHIYTVIERFSKLIELHHNNLVKDRKGGKLNGF